MSEESWRKWIRKSVQAANPLLWILDNCLACAPRPLRYHPAFGGRVPLIASQAAPVLREWLEAVRMSGVGTIVVLATPGELKRYSLVASPEPDLLSLYRSFGFLVHHNPVEDPAHAPAYARVGILQQMEALKPVVFAEYQTRIGAMLISCSGGMDRSAPIAAFVASKAAGPCPFV
jgi:hypothetical protein